MTLVFENIRDVVINFEIPNDSYQWEINNIKMHKIGMSPNNKFTQYQIEIDLHNGTIVFETTGYKMYVKKSPILSEKYSLGINGRGGINFDKKHTT